MSGFLCNVAPETTQDELGAAHAVQAHHDRLRPYEVERLAPGNGMAGDMISWIPAEVFRRVDGIVGRVK